MSLELCSFDNFEKKWEDNIGISKACYKQVNVFYNVILNKKKSQNTKCWIQHKNYYIDRDEGIHKLLQNNIINYKKVSFLTKI